MAAGSVTGPIITGVAGYQAGEYNRAADYSNAVSDERAGDADEARIRDQSRQAIGQQIAAQGANGFQQGTGSALDALTQSQINATLDAMNARYTAASKARAARAAGDVAYAQGQNALVQGLIGAGSNAAKIGTDWAQASAMAAG